MEDFGYGLWFLVVINTAVIIVLLLVVGSDGTTHRMSDGSHMDGAAMPMHTMQDGASMSGEEMDR